MKKVVLLASMLFLGASSFARDNKFLTYKKSDKGIISNGFYLNLGLGMPSGKITSVTFDGLTVDNLETERQSFGFQPSLEIGNQWYFYNNDKIGAGIKVSWFQFGYSSAKIKNSDGDKVKTLDLKFLKVGPQFSMALSDETALDFSLLASPTVLVNTYSYSASTDKDLGTSFGVLLEPGVRFRYNKFAVGFDCALGKSAGAMTTTGSSSNDVATTYKQSNLQPRLTLGFKF